MKLMVMIVDTATGRHLVLCDESGEALPGQTNVTLADFVGGAPRLTVEFVVDGKELSLAGERAGSRPFNVTISGGSWPKAAIDKLMEAIAGVTEDGRPIR